MERLIALTLTWNGKDKLENLYKSFLPTLPDDNWMWYLKDNGSTDETMGEVLSWNNQRIVCFNYPNNLQNYSQGNNWLFNKANPDNNDYILLLNNDIIFQDTSSIKNMISILDNDQEVGVVGAKLNYWGGPNIIQHCGVLPHPQTGTPYHYRSGKSEEKKDRQNRYYPMITGAVMMTRASLWREIGGLNEALQWSWDDVFYCMEIQERGFKVIYCGETNILHSESATLKKNPVNKLFFKQNHKIFMDRWASKMDKTLVDKYTKDPSYMLYK